MARNQVGDGEMWTADEATVVRNGKRIGLGRIADLPEDEWRAWALDRTANPALDPFINWVILNSSEPRVTAGGISTWSEGHALVSACEVVNAERLRPPAALFQPAEAEWRRYWDRDNWWLRGHIEDVWPLLEW